MGLLNPDNWQGQVLTLSEASSIIILEDRGELFREEFFYIKGILMEISKCINYLKDKEKKKNLGKGEDKRKSNGKTEPT